MLVNIINPRMKHFKRSKHLYYYSIAGYIDGINKIRKIGFFQSFSVFHLRL